MTKKKRKPGPLLMFSNKNICPSLQTAHISLHLCVSSCCCFHSNEAHFSSDHFCQQKPRCTEEQSFFLFFVSPSTRPGLGSHARRGGHGLSSDQRPCHRCAPDATDSGATVLFAACQQPSENSCLVLWRGSRSPSDHFTGARGQTLSEMNFQRKG